MRTKKGCSEHHYYQIEHSWLEQTAGSCKIQFQTIGDQIKAEEDTKEQNRLCALYDFMLGCETALKNIHRAPDDAREAGSFFASLAFEKPLTMIGGNDDE